MAALVRVGRKECCDFFMDQLGINMVVWWLHGLAEDHKGGFCGHSVRHRLQSVLKWLYGLTENHQGSLLGLAWVYRNGFCAYFGRFMINRVL